MTGTVLILLLAAVIAGRLRGVPPAARVGVASAAAIGGPIIFLSALARFGIHANAVVVVCVFATLTGVTFAATQRRQSLLDDPAWLGVLGLAITVALLSALLGRPPTLGVLIDPWAHLAWSRDLPDALRFYPPGFAAFNAVLGLDDRLIGAFRLSPFLLHTALAAQFLALGERVGALWPAAGAALVYLVIPIAFGKFEPPRPELLAAVIIAASWWVVLSEHLKPRWKCVTLGGLTCALLITHFSVPEIAHLSALGIAIIVGGPSQLKTGRIALLLSMVAGIAVSLIISPWPLTLIFRPDLLPLAAVRFSVPGLPDPVTIARMVGLGLGVAGMAAFLWIVFHLKGVNRETAGPLIGLCVLGVLNLAPLAMAAVGIPVPIALEPYRFFLAAALPLAMIVTLVAGLSLMHGGIGRIGVILCAGVVALDILLRPTFSPLLGIATAGIIATAWWTARRVRRPSLLYVAVFLTLSCAVAVRLAIWWPTPPPHASWLEEHGSPETTVVTNWPLTNALDALVPQHVVDGLAGNDGNVARHRAFGLSPLHDRLNWCEDHVEGSVERLRAALDEMNALPAYLVVGDRFEESWSLYSQQHGESAASGEVDGDPFYAAAPCPETAAFRVEKIRSALESHHTVTVEYSTERVAVYRME